MKNKISFLLSLFLVGVSVLQSYAQGVFLEKTFTSESGYNLPYRLLLPDNYDPSEKYPLVLFLHGAGERGSDNKAQLTHGVKLFAQAESRANFPCIVIAPQCPKDSYWASVKVDRSNYPVSLDFDYSRESNEPLQAAIELVKSFIANKKAIKKRVYITGLSMGGMGTFEAVYKNPKLFKAAMPVCGGGDIEAFNKRMAKVPFWVFHGDVDGVIEVSNSRNAVEKLKSLNADVTYTEYPGVNHNSWENAYAEKGFLSWMFSH